MQTITVTTAIELTKTQQTAIEKKLAQKFDSNAEIVFEVDPAIIGGITLTVGSHYYDGSIQAKLEAIKAALYQQL